ncbi:glutathione S-transferase [Sinorhizobium medicae]|uniref:glutathione S-transferase N-terminal domain-containing protein n=1 Tax=Sinorhizobium medicae TaxID=110321 RepID=UPI000FD7C88E|nr:glutathione S-transferase N-terminal domain-containing protein [Sinorhizobium medicae]MDX0583818.1 glutathione S-transferase [Sinorhizobium medicae]MDX0970689.1 glutathione S-transferase [Sinorhizobium medicae]MDX1145971.1 glutathione S-transferase [Sinorhizobium medicae]RVH91789.1 glutathione S-transferase [Sinorhizobium medicae]RVP64976.1 glutathione S-transferase [Sinorhizobium medicae]
MKLYYSPKACSLADHIALQEAGAKFELERVNPVTKRTASGRDFNDINPKGCVPVIEMDDGSLLTENVAILDWIAAQFPKLGVPGEMGRTRLIEALTFISTELHHSFRHLLDAKSEEEEAQAKAGIRIRFRWISGTFKGHYLFDDHPSVADFYLFVMLLWAERFDVNVPTRLTTFKELMRSRAAVSVALAVEAA